MTLKELLDTYFNLRVKIKVYENYILDEMLKYAGEALDCPFWLVDFELCYGDGWRIEDEYLLIAVEML